MTTPQPPTWQLWAPPMDPPTTGGLPVDTAQAIADQWWALEPHLCAALQWESYAAMLPPTPTVASVQTGAQSVSYSPAQQTGDAGLAWAQAARHRSFVSGQLVTVPLNVAPPPLYPAEIPAPWWGVDIDDLPPDEVPPP